MHQMKVLLWQTRCLVTAIALALVGSNSHAAVIVDFADDFESPATFATQWSAVTTGVPGGNTVFAPITDHPVVPSAYDLGSIQGDRIIRTWNKGITTPPTAAPVIGDVPTGVIETAPFVLGNWAQVNYRIGGGSHAWGGADPDTIPAGVATFNLEREVTSGDWETIRTDTGPNANSLTAKSWNVRDHAGETVRLRIYDTNTGGWGHIDVDEIKVTSDPDRVAVQVHNFENPIEFASNWSRVPQSNGDDSVFNPITDHPVVPSAYDLTSIEGDRIIRTWNKGITTPPTAAPIIGDTPTGVAESAAFELGEEALIEFLIGGGNHPWDLINHDPDSIPSQVASFNLERMVDVGDWDVLFSATGPNANSLSPMLWDASAYEGETVRFRIYDTATGGWGHIDVDDIVVSQIQSQIQEVPEPASWAMWLAVGMVLSWLGWRRNRSRK